MAKQVRLLRNLSLTVLALVITLVPAVSVIGQESITLTTIMPSQDTLRVKRGAVGLPYGDSTQYSDTDIVDNNLIIEGKVGIGTPTPGAVNKLHVVGGSDGSATGIYGESAGMLGYGVFGISTGLGTGVSGSSDGLAGVHGSTNTATGVFGQALTTGTGVIGMADTGIAGSFSSTSGYGLIVGQGNVGIGTTTPNAALQVNGAISKQGTTLHGDYTDGHVNLGNNSTTGLSGADYRFCTVLGGDDNVAAAPRATASGYANRVYGIDSSIFGGRTSTVKANYSAIFGSTSSTIDSTSHTSAILGGYANYINAHQCIVTGSHARGLHFGSFVWQGITTIDPAPTDYDSHAVGSFNIKAPGGAFLDGTSSWLDIAEFMDVPETEDIQEAELVALIGEDLLGKTQDPYDENLVGVISSERTTTLHLGTTAPLKEGTERLPVALVGRCFVKVYQESGPIKIGDPITSSSIPGAGMRATKAGKIIGYAMQSENFKDNELKEILVFVNLGYYVPESEFKELKQRIEKLELAIKK